MTMTKKIGFPAIRNFGNDPRDFVPELFRFMDRYDAEFYLEKAFTAPPSPTSTSIIRNK